MSGGAIFAIVFFSLIFGCGIIGGVIFVLHKLGIILVEIPEFIKKYLQNFFPEEQVDENQ
jgi:hypothetical protein